MTSEERQKRYAALAHAVQTGVAFVMGKEIAGNGSTSPKHLRVGVNMAMVEHAALATLLTQKGIITDDEYGDALIAELEREVERYTQEVRDLYGTDNITLG